MSEESPVTMTVKTRFADPGRYKVSDARVVEVKSFLWGKIHQVRFPRANGSEKTVYVWEPEVSTKAGDITEGLSILEDEEAIVSFVSLYQPQIIAKAGELAKRSLISKFGPVELVSEIIALLLTGTIIVIIIFQLTSNKSLDVPAILSNVLTIIVGFYFGKASNNPTPESPRS
jgi:hypothetical protein